MIEDKSKELKADMMLLIVTLFWGVSYYLMDISLKEVPTFTLNAYRFLGAFFVAFIFSYKSMIKINKMTLFAGGVVGITLSFVYMFATIGVQNTTLSNSAFLCATTVFFTPIIDWVVNKKRPTKKIIIAVIVCFIGISLLTLKEDFSFNMSNLKGDLFSLGCGLCYALQIVFTGGLLKNKSVDAYKMGVMSLGFCGLIMMVLSLIFETPIAVPQTPAVWFAVIFLSLFCTGVSFIVQPIAQQYTEPSHVGIIISLEPVFAGITAFALAGELLTVRGYLGQVLMIIAIFYMEIDFENFFKKYHKRGQ